MVMLLLLLLCVLPLGVQAADRFVRITGSNNGTCSTGAPCRDIQYVLDNVLQDGEILNVGSGDYSNETPFVHSSLSDVTIRREPGAPTKPLVGASFTVQDPSFGVTIDGFIVDGDNRNNWYCFWLADGVFDLTLLNSEGRNCGGQGILAHGNNHTYIGNYLHDNGVVVDRDHNIYINGDGHVIRGNYVARGFFYNLQCSQTAWDGGQGCTNTIVEQNTWTGSDAGVTFDWRDPTNIFRNNIMFDDNLVDGGAYCARAGASGMKMLHNTFVNCGVRISDNADGVEVANNIFVGGQNIENNGTNTNSHNNLFFDPGLTGPPTPTSPGYRLLSTSTAAIGQAPCRGDVPNDIDDNSRPQQGSCDLGADEFTGTIVESPLHLGWITEPSNVVVNTNMVPALRIEVHREDHSVVTTGPESTASITLSRIAGTGCNNLSCGAGGCTKNAVGGVSIYSTVQFSDAGTGCTLQVSASFNTRVAETPFIVESAGVTPVLTDMIFSTPPSNDTVGVAITPTVEVQLRDQQGAPFTGLALLVTLSIATGPVGAVLSNNTATTNTGTGRATFTNLSLNLTGTYTLQAVASGVSAITSTSFVIDPIPTGIPRLVLSPGTNKRYFVSATTGQPIYVAGTHTWTVFQDRTGETIVDFPALMTKYNSNWDSPQGGLAKHNMLRFWMAEHKMGGEQLVTPNPFMQDGPGGVYNFGPSAGNCTLSNPDQPRFNQAYFDRMATRVAQAKASGVYLAIMLFQGWSLYSHGFGDPWADHPETGFHWFHPDGNCNGIDGFPNSAAQGLGFNSGQATMARAPMKGGVARTVTNHNTIWRIQVAYVKKVINTIHSAAAGGGDNVVYEIINEAAPYTSDWQDDLIQEIKAYEAQTAAGACGGQTCKVHLVGKTTFGCDEGAPEPFCEVIGGNDGELLNSPADWISLAQYANFPDGDHDPAPPPASRPNISDGDHGYIGGAFTPERQWKFFFRGHNVWFMDEWTFMTDTGWLPHRRATGHTVAYADKVNMTNMTIQAKGTSSPANSGYSLVNAAAGHYMALKLGGTLTFAVPNGTYSCEWFNIDTRVVQSCGTVTTTPGSQPFTNAVLLLKSTAAMAQTLTSIAYITQPNNENVNTAMTPPVTVEVRDQDGLPYTTAPVAVELRIYQDPGGVVVSNGTATTSAATGRATLAPAINLPGTYRFRAVAFEGGIGVTDTVSANDFVISSAEPLATTLTFAPPLGVQPTTTAVGAVMTPAVKVAVLDQSGALYTATPVTVTLALATFPGGATMGGTLARVTSGGIATFDNLSFPVAGTIYSLSATAPGGLTAPASTTFTITTPVAALGTVGALPTRGVLLGR